MNPAIATTDLERRTRTLADEATSLAVVDQQTYDVAAERLRALVTLRGEIIDHHAPMRRSTHQAHQAVLAAEKRLLDPVAAAEAILKQHIAVYTTEQQRIAYEARQRAEAEARAIAEAQREQEIEAAEAAGADAQEIRAICDEPLPVVVPELPAPTFQKAAGISTADSWKGECVSLTQLVRAIAEGKAPGGLVAVNQPALNQLARATRGTLAIPGVRFSNVPVVRARR